VDPDFSCFLCRKRCRTKSRFLAHFRSHFKAAGKRRRHPDAGATTDATDDDDDDSDDSSSHGGDASEPVHLRGVTADTKAAFRPHPRRRRKSSRASKRSSAAGAAAADPDADSGCHSVDDGSSSSSSPLSDCPGDSESSDDERFVTRPKRRHAVTAKDRLSLAEKQLDNNETEGLICLTCLKRFSNCQNLRRHLRLHISRDSVTPDIEKNSVDNDDDDFDGRYFCDWCPARFDNRSAARVHENTHKGQVRFRRFFFRFYYIPVPNLTRV
jgi:hypothetical protein